MTKSYNQWWLVISTHTVVWRPVTFYL